MKTSLEETKDQGMGLLLSTLQGRGRIRIRIMKKQYELGMKNMKKPGPSKKRRSATQ